LMSRSGAGGMHPSGPLVENSNGQRPIGKQFTRLS
jgi:hypothetical protein